MDRHKFIEFYKKRLANIRPEYQKHHRIDEDGIHCYFIDQWHTVSIDDCLAVIDLWRSALAFVYGLTVNRVVCVNTYGIDCKARIEKINYKTSKRKKNGERFISSFSVVKDYGNGNGFYAHDKIKKENIYFEGRLIKDIADAYKHVVIFSSFSRYDVENIKRVVGTVEAVH